MIRREFFYRGNLVVLLVILVVVLTSCESSVASSTDSKRNSEHDQRPIPVAEQGKIDVSEWDFVKKGAISLEGEWAFYWGELLEPSDFSRGNPPHGQWVFVPSIWNRYEINGEKLPGTGYATYRLQLYVGDSTDVLALKIPYASTAYRMWINDILVASNGEVGIDKTTSHPQYINHMTYIVDQDSTITIQVSNFHHRSGGLFQPLEIGTVHDIATQTQLNIAVHLFLFGSLFIMGIYFIALFCFRPKALYHLYFGIICVLFGIQNLFIGEVMITKLFEHFSWEMALKMEYLCATVAKFLFVPLFINRLFPNMIPNRLMKAIILLPFIPIMIILVTPASVYSHYVVYGNIYNILLMIYLWFIIYLASKNRMEGAKTTLLFFSFFMFTVINDILNVVGTISTGYYLYWGLYCYLFGQALILSKNFSKAFTTIENLSQQLRNLNEKLEDKVRNRTKELEETNGKLMGANQKLAQKNEKIIEYEESRKQLFANISHELRTPITLIQGYLEALIHDVIQDPEKKKQHLIQTHGKIIRLNQLIEDLFELSRLEVKKTSFHKSMVSVEEWLDQAINDCALDIRQAGLQFEYHNDLHDKIKAMSLYIDSHRLEQVFANLVMNAIKFSPANSTIRITVEEYRIPNDKRLKISISDEGTGIPQDELSKIFERFYKSKHNSTQQGSGLGLAISKAIIEAHEGNIWAEQNNPVGSQFCMTLPIFESSLENKHRRLS
ncbi:ATP-binding protein [Aquibacillus albus]|uniref:histidine kinase n=1 Tax=Aquibacillus albus TaxID=1168171 RepID=A0ABS2N5P1_9BACI|nr:ATP-binding protein [Aquibacillus albus]MBM7573437.1 signal transduction histidine kinase [Aquibacillus albus]